MLGPDLSISFVAALSEGVSTVPTFTILRDALVLRDSLRMLDNG